MNANMERGAAQGSDQYQVADLLIDVARQRVTRADVEISLPKLSFDLLLAMIRAAPKVLSIDELMTQVWPGIVVSPETVSQRVKLLRDALGDNPHNPRYIAGLRGRGYRLMPDVEAVADRRRTDAAAPVMVAQPARSAVDLNSHARGRRWAIVSALLGVAFLAVATIVVIAWRSQPRQSTAPDTVMVVGLPPRTVAVLPFENLSPDPANEYLALGMAEMVLNRLARISEIVVIARSSSFRFRGENLDAGEIGRKLEARYLVEGGVQRDGEKLRVTARLIDAQNGAQLESLHFDRGLAEIFTIQDEIADKIAAALETNLATTIVAGASMARSENIDAWLAYLQGRELLEQWSATGSEQAAQQFETAIALDPDFAAAYVGLADAQIRAAHGRWEFGTIGDLPPASVVAKVVPLLEKAIALDPSMGDAYLSRANTREDLTLIEADYRKGLELDPANSRGLVAFAEFLGVTDRVEEGMRALDRALLVDPLSARAHYLKALSAWPTIGSLAVEQKMIDVLRIDPNFQPALFRLGKLRWVLHGEFAEAVKLEERAIALDPGSPISRYTAYLIYLDMGDLAAAIDVSNTIRDKEDARFQLLQYRGDWRAAGEAAHRFPDWLDETTGHRCEAIAAIRDLALGAGEHHRAIRKLESDYDLSELRDAKEWSCQVIYFAQLLKADGRRDEAMTLLNDQLAWLNAKTPDFTRRRRMHAYALAVQDRRDAALDELADAFRSGDRSNWWYTIDHDPLYADMRSDPRFKAIAAEARAHAAHQRALLEEMRRKGETPIRPSSAPQHASR
jgi:TolB-like protein/DNA-binding winged helix-turn-helix (wHTH) protein